jgi:hypothetical protein
MTTGNYPWPYNILELSEDKRTESDVKRAYARLLKNIDQSTEADKFQALRTAYTVGRQRAGGKQGSGERIFVAPPVSPQPDPQPASKPASKPDPQPKAKPNVDNDHHFLSPDWNYYEKLRSEMSQMLRDKNYDSKRWMNILSDPVMDFPAAAQAAETCIVAGLRGQNAGSWLFVDPSPSKDWFTIIENRYGWVVDGLRFERQFPADRAIRKAFKTKYLTGRPEMAPPQTAQATPAAAPNDIPFYLRWWFIIASYLLFWVLTQ